MSSIESAIVEAVTTDSPQVILSAGDALDAFDGCLERVLQQQLRLDAEGVVRSWLHTQLIVPVRMPKSRSPIEAFYQQIVKKAGPETLAGFWPDQHLKDSRRDSEDSVVRALVLLSEAVQKGYAELKQELFAYLLTARSQEALAEMGLSENLEHLDDKLFVLSTILQCLIGVKAKIGTGGAVGPACRVYLMLDEVENLLILPGEIAWAFLRVLESLSHDVGGGLTLWLHIKTTEATTIEEVKKRLGSRLLREWITHALVETVPSTRNKRGAPTQAHADDEPVVERGTAHALLNVRDINMICQEYGDVYALIEGEKRRRKINRARRRQGVLEIRTAARDEWKGPVAWIEWTNDLDAQVRYTAQDIR